jgi:hypothetical protein
MASPIVMMNLELDPTFIAEAVEASGTKVFREALAMACDKYLNVVVSRLKEAGYSKAPNVRQTRPVALDTHKKFSVASDELGMSRAKLIHCCLTLLVNEQKQS